MNIDLSGRAVAVTGASSGIGEATALARAGGLMPLGIAPVIAGRLGRQPLRQRQLQAL